MSDSTIKVPFSLIEKSHNEIETENNSPEKRDGEQTTKKEVIIETRQRLITSALPYINNVPHLGHIVGSHLPADIFARYSRLKGIPTLLIGGSDEHGTPSELAAEELGIDHKIFCDVLHGMHKKIYEWFGISYDNYSRTGNPKHKEIVQKLFKEIMEAGHISKETIEMFYDAKAGRFLADRYIEGTCPKCGFKEASGDQCEVCTHVLDPKEIINPISKISGSTPELKKTEHLFLDLEKFTDKLISWIESRDTWRPQVKNLALGWLHSGLKKRCITRDLKHGIEVPVAGMDDKVLYVWFEAPIAYISFLAEIEENWEKYWGKKREGEVSDTEIYHFLGKDNIPFHTIFWPAILMAAGKYTLPDHVEGMQYLNYEGGKFSKSKKRGVFCEALLESTVPPDLLRSYLASIIPGRTDREFSWSDLQQHTNKILTDNLSNFVHRSSSLSFTKFEGQIERPSELILSDIDKRLIDDIGGLVNNFEKQMDAVHLREGFATVFEVSSLGNKYINDTAPWKALKEDPQRAKTILYICAYVSKIIAVLLTPFLPETATKIWKQMNFEGNPSDPANWIEASNFDKMPATQKVNEPQKLFSKISDEDMVKVREQLSKITELSEFFKK